MVLMKIGDFDPQYKEAFGGYDVKGLSVYADIDDDKVGNVHDLLVDENGRFRYLVVDLGFWGFGKKVLLPVGRSRVDSDNERVYAVGFTKKQAEQLPEFGDNLRIDSAYEALVHGVYQPNRSAQSTVPESSNRAATPQSQQPYSQPQAPSPAAMPGQQPTPAAPQASYGQQAGQPVHQGYSPQPHPAQGNMPEQRPSQPYTQQPPVQSPGQGNQPDSQHGQQPMNQHPNASYPSGGGGYATPEYSAGSVPNGGNRSYDYRQDPDLYEMNPQNHGLFQRYEERLMQRARQSGARR
jgi:stress response protein YsnF